LFDALKIFVDSFMLFEPVVEEKMILVDEFRNDKGEVITHSTSFVFLVRHDKRNNKDVRVSVH
jgi:hypothetical protein